MCAYKMAMLKTKRNTSGDRTDTEVKRGSTRKDKAGARENGRHGDGMMNREREKDTKKRKGIERE